MDKLFEASLKIIEKMFDIFGLIGRTLFNNLFFQILLGLVILSLLIGLVFYFVKNIKGSNKRKSIYIGNAKASYMVGNKHVAEYKGIKNGQVVYYKKVWNKNGKLIYDGTKDVDETFE